jgi:hypothetical protein
MGHGAVSGGSDCDAISACLRVYEEQEPWVPGKGLGRPGTTWRLADRPWARSGRRDAGAARSWLPSVATSVPSDIIDSDLPCACVGVGVALPLLKAAP